MGPVWSHLRPFGQDHALGGLHSLRGKLWHERKSVGGPQKMLLDMDQSHPGKNIYVMQSYCGPMLHRAHII